MDPVTPPAVAKDDLTYYETIMLYESGLIGFKEARKVLAYLYPSFALAHDPELDLAEEQ